MDLKSVKALNVNEQIQAKFNIPDEDLMIHALHTKEYDVILDGPENHLTLSSDDILSIEVNGEKIEKFKNKVCSGQVPML